MQRRGVKFGFLWGITFVSFLAGCTASKRVNNCVAGAVVGAGVGAAIGAGTGATTMNIATTPCWVPELARWSVVRCRMFTGKRGSRSLPAPPPRTDPAATGRTTATAPPPPAPKRIILRGVNFDFNKSNINSSSPRSLMKQPKPSKTILT